MQSVKRKTGYGIFGNLSENYNKARKGFPDEVIEYIFKNIGLENPRILDIGCGTGIATKQLVKKGASTVGTDFDERMISEAKILNPCSIDYFVAPAEEQPFESKMFNAVTAFSSFHWFTTKEAVNEMKRVLKTDGYIFIINKNEAGDFKKGYKSCLRKYITEIEIPDVKKHFNPKNILEINGLNDIEEKEFIISEWFTLDEAVRYCQTVSLWNLVPDKEKEKALRDVRSYLKKLKDNNKMIERKVCISIVSGKYN